MQISKIEKQKHDERRFSVFIDGEFAFGISGVDLLYYKLEEGAEISAERLKELFDTVLFQKARDKAIRFLGYRMRSRKEIENKLHEEDFPPQVIENVIELLERHNYINDRQFAESFINDVVKFKGYGKPRLEHELEQKGISREIITQALEEAEFDEISLALAHLQKKARGEKDLDERQRRRCEDYLQRRGFSYDIIKEAFKIYNSDDYD